MVGQTEALRIRISVLSILLVLNIEQKRGAMTLQYFVLTIAQEVELKHAFFGSCCFNLVKTQKLWTIQVKRGTAWNYFTLFVLLSSKLKCNQRHPERL